MNVLPVEEDIEIAADLLVNAYGISTQKLNQLFGEQQRNDIGYILNNLNGNRLTKFDLAKLLIIRKGAELFGGSSEVVRNLRLTLLTKLPDDIIDELYEKHGTNKSITSPSHKRRPLAHKSWHASGPWPNSFVKALGFPKIFAGVLQKETLPTVDDFDPLKRPPKLVEFQEHLKMRMLEVLEREGNKTRCVITLPTGGGKTRVAVEAFIDWMHKRFSKGKYLIWIAQSEELCEQALSCIEQMWGSFEYVSPLRVYRYYGGRDVRNRDLKGGAVVASIQQIHNRIKLEDPVLIEFLKNTGAMIIDEAHRAVTAMYDILLDRAEEVCGPDLFPICGLTATPGRAGLNNHNDTVKLVDRFDAYLVEPSLDDKYLSKPLQYFRENGYLARPRHFAYQSGKEYELTDKEIEQMTREGDFPSGFRKRLAGDLDRNILIVKKLLELDKGTPTIIYACTVEHAYTLSVILNTVSDRCSAVISSETPMTIRRGIIQDFKTGRIEFIFNYGVLTTGFDAPKTECIVICRPTTSEILYEQILGRGLRGPKFGGTEECLVIDFADNIIYHGPPLAYARFRDFWSEEVLENSVS